MVKTAAQRADQQNAATFANQPGKLSRPKSREQYIRHTSERIENDTSEKSSVCDPPNFFISNAYHVLLTYLSRYYEIENSILMALLLASETRYRTANIHEG